VQGTEGSGGGSRCTQEQGTETRAFVSGFHKSPSKGSLPVSHPEPWRSQAEIVRSQAPIDVCGPEYMGMA
jgi:hypothetical protein